MPTSAEIAASIADQNQMFLAQNAMASQIGVTPAAMGGAMAAPGSFNYGNSSSFDTTWGSRAGAVGMGALAAAPALAMTGGNILAMTKFGSGLAPFMNPVSAFTAARGLGAGYGLAAGAAGASMLPWAAAGHGVSQMVRGGWQQGLVNTAVGNYQFANSNSMSGFGFSRTDAQQIGRQVRQLAMIPELMTSFEEVTRILPRLKDSGAMAGVKDATEFGRRMKESIATIRDVSKILGSTLEEASDFFTHSRSLGFLGRNEQVRNAMNARVTMSMTGQNQQQVMQGMQVGANFGTAIGGSRALGVEAINRFTQKIAAGGVNQETLLNLTGKNLQEGGAQDLAAQLMSWSVQNSDSPVGKFMLLGASTMGEDGKLHIDEELLKGDKGALRSRGQRMFSGNRKMAQAFLYQHTRLAQEAATKGGPEAMLGLLKGMLGGDLDTAKYVLHTKFGASEELTEAIGQLYKNGESGMLSQQKHVEEMLKRSISMRENAPDAVMKRLGTKFQNKVSEPFRKMGAEIKNNMENWVDEIVQDITGNYAVTLSEQVQNEFKSSFTSGKMKDFLKLSASSGVGVSVSGVDAGSFSSWFRNTSMGEAIFGASGGTGRTNAKQMGISSEILFGRTGFSADSVNDGAARLDQGYIWANQDVKFDDLNDFQQQMGKGFARIAQETMASPEYTRAESSAAKNEILREAADKYLRGKRGWFQTDSGADPAQALIQAARFSGAADPRVFTSAVDSLGVNREGTLKAINHSERDVRDEMKKVFGAEGAQMLMADENLRTAAMAYDKLSGDKRRAADAAFGSGSVEAYNDATGSNLNKEQFGRLRQSLQYFRDNPVKAGYRQKDDPIFGFLGVKSGAGEWVGELNMSDTLGKVGELDTAKRRQAASGTIRDWAGMLEQVQLGGDLGASHEALKKALTAYADEVDPSNTTTQEKIAEREKAMWAAFDTQASQFEKLGDKDPALQNSYVRAIRDRRRGARSGLKKLQGGASESLQQMADASGLSVEEVMEVGGFKGVDQKSFRYDVDEQLTTKLAQAAGRKAAGAGLSPEEQARKTREETQINLLRLMSEAIVGSNDKMQQEIAKNPTGDLARRVKGAGFSTPGEK